MILDRLPVTLELTLIATLAAALIGVPLGLLGGGGRRAAPRIAPRSPSGSSASSLPDFWLGIMLILLVSLGTGLLRRAASYPSPRALSRTSCTDPARHHAAASRAAVLGRLTRAAVLDTVRRGFVQYARAKGLAERAVLVRHVLPMPHPHRHRAGLQTG